MRKVTLLIGVVFAFAAAVAAAGPPVVVADAPCASVATLGLALPAASNTVIAVVSRAQEVPAPGAIAVGTLADNASNNGAAFGMAPHVGIASGLTSHDGGFGTSPPDRFVPS